MIVFGEKRVNLSQNCFHFIFTQVTCLTCWRVQGLCCLQQCFVYNTTSKCRQNRFLGDFYAFNKFNSEAMTANEGGEQERSPLLTMWFVVKATRGSPENVLIVYIHQYNDDCQSLK